MNDIEAYRAYPQHRLWYNKLWLSELLKYDCGPASIAPTKSGWYIVRPIMNLSGMGVGAEKIWIDGNDHTKVNPGFFWCEWFEGNQYSVTYECTKNQWNPVSSWHGSKEEHNLSKFTKWQRVSFYPEIDDMFNALFDVKKINIEFIENKVIEVHLRTSSDPDYDEIIPIWENEESLIDKYLKMDYSYITSYDNADGFLKPARLGFVVKNQN